MIYLAIREFRFYSNHSGAVAHQGERLNGIEEVGGSIPPSSTTEFSHDIEPTIWRSEVKGKSRPPYRWADPFEDHFRLLVSMSGEILHKTTFDCSFDSQMIETSDRSTSLARGMGV